MSVAPNTIAPTAEDVLSDKLSTVLTETSKRILGNQTGFNDIACIERTGHARKVHGHWKSAILLTSANIQLGISTFFSYQQSAPLLEQRSRCIQRDLNIGFVKDFFREYCNLIAGGVKSELRHCGIDAGIGLPLVSRGFDDVLLRTKRSLQLEDVSHLWSLSHADGFVICEYQARVTDWTELSLLGDATDSANDFGQIEFL